jgi:hypothetical protein
MGDIILATGAEVFCLDAAPYEMNGDLSAFSILGSMST